MKANPLVTIRVRRINGQTAQKAIALVREKVAGLVGRRPIEARVLIERRLEASPPFSVSAHLVVPGPDIHAQAVEHTWRAALLSAVTQLEGIIRRRRLKRDRQARSDLNITHTARLALAGARNRSTR